MAIYIFKTFTWKMLGEKSINTFSQGQVDYDKLDTECMHALIIADNSVLTLYRFSFLSARVKIVKIFQFFHEFDVTTLFLFCILFFNQSIYKKCQL